MSYLKNNFNGGEVGGALRYRADLAKFANCEEKLENFFVLPQGGIENRPGTIRIGAAQDQTELSGSAPRVRLIPFQFNNSEKFCLEFGNHYIHVHGADVTITTYGDNVAVPYAAADLEEIRYTQKNDILFLAHPKYAPMMLKRYGNSSWALEKFSPKGGPWLDTGNNGGNRMSAYQYVRPGSSVYEGFVRMWADESFFTADMVGARIRLINTRIENGFTHRFTGNGDISTGQNAKKERCFGSWKFRSYGSWVGTLSLLRSTDNGANWEVYRVYRSNADDNADDGGYEEDVDAWYSCKLEDWESAPSGVLYECRVTFTHEDYEAQGDATIYEIVNSKQALAKVDHEFYWEGGTADSMGLMHTQLSDEWSLDAWNEHQGYPAQVAFHSSDRLVFASTEQEPQTLYFSAVGDYTNFTPGTQADNAMTITLNTGRYNAIRWLCEMGDQMYLGCANGVTRLQSTDSDAPIAPGKVRAVPSGVTGAAPITAVPSGEAILFVRRGARALMEFAYQYSDDVYRTPEMSILNPDILDAGIREIHLRQSPYPMLLALRNDGVLCCFTYNRNEEVMAWSRIVPASSGAIESVCVLDTDGKDDEIYLAVRRSSGRTVEKIAPRLDSDAAAGCYLDCAVEKSSGTAISIFTVTELAGSTVTVNADGVIHRDLVVGANGALKLPAPACHIWAGLPYNSVMRTLPLEVVQTPQGSFNEVKRAPEMILKTMKTWGGQIATLNDGRPVEMAARNFSASLDGAIDRQLGDVGLTLFNAPRREQQIEVRQVLPLPMTILALLVEAQ